MGFPVQLLNQKRLGGVPGVVKANARALYLTRPGAYSSTRLLDQSPLNTGTRRTGQEGRCYHFDGTDDYVTGGDISLTVKTVAFRIEPIDGVTSGTAYVIDLNGTDYIEIAAQGATGLVRTQGYSGATVTRYINGVPATTVALGSFQSVVVVSDVGFSASDFEIGRLAAACSEFKIFDVRLSSESLTAGQVTSYHTFGESGDAVTWDLWLKCDEQDGITSYDSSGNGRDTTITNATLATFHATQDIYSFQNQVGYNKRMYFDGVDDYVNFGSVGNMGVNCKVELDFSTKDQGQWLFCQRDASNRSCMLYQLTSASSALAFYNANGSITIWTGKPGGIEIRDGKSHNLIFEKNGNDLSITIDGYTVSATKAFADSGNIGDFAVGGHPNELSEFEGSISNVKVDVGNTGTWDLESNGYGNTNADWLDTSGNGNNGTVNGSPSNLILPRDESDPTNDVLGNPLTYTGRRPNDAALHSSNCLTADGTLYIAAAHLAGTETVASSGGTSTPSISAGRIDFTAGTCWDLLLSDGTHYKLAEGYGTEILDASGNGNHGVLTSAVLANAWGVTQDVYHSNLLEGCGKRMWFDGVNDYVNFGSIGNLGVNCKVQFDFSTRFSGQVLFSQRDANRSCMLYQLTSSNTISFYNSNGNIPIWIGTPNGINIRDRHKHTLVFEKNGNDLSITIDGYTVSATKAFADSGNTGDFAVGGHPNELSEFEGSISNVKVDAGNTGTWDLESNGYGNTDADWIDATGNGNDGTVVGSPEAFYIPAAPNGLDVFGNELTEKPSAPARNRAETTLDFNPDDTPEMGSTQLGITVPTAHAFGDAFAASTQIFARQRTATEDRNIVMTEAQTGAALTAIQNYTAP